MSCLILVLGFVLLGIAVLYLPFLTVTNLAISLAISGVSFVLGLWVHRVAGSRHHGGLGRVGGTMLMVTSVVCAGFLLFFTSPKELYEKTSSGGRAKSKKGFTVELVSPRPEGRRIDDEFTFSVSGGVFLDRDESTLDLRRTSGDGRVPAKQSFKLESASVQDGGQTLRFSLDSPLDYGATYHGRLNASVAVGRNEREITSEWSFTTEGPTIINGVDPRGFSIRVGSSGAGALQMVGGSVSHTSPVRKVAVFSAHENYSTELARKAVKPGWPATIEFASTERQLVQRALWVSALDANDHPVARFPVSRLEDEDGRGVFVISGNGEHTTTDGVTIHYGPSSWQKPSGEKASRQVPVVMIRVERLLEYECLARPPDGFAVVGCYEITVRDLKDDSRRAGSSSPLKDPSASQSKRGKTELMPSFTLSFPAPEGIEEGRIAVAVVEEEGHRFAPDLRLTGVGHVVADDGNLRIRFTEGGGAVSPEVAPSSVPLGELFEADAMIGRRAILVAKGLPDTALVVGTGWNRMREEFADGRIVKKYEDCRYFTMSVDIAFKPPTFGRVRAKDAFVLPMVVGETSLLARLDPHTGWILDRSEVTVPRNSGWLVDIGSMARQSEEESWRSERWDDEIRAWRKRR